MLKPSDALFLAQMFAHLALIPMIMYGTVSHWLVAILVYFFTGCIGMSVTFHRLLSHKSFESPRWFLMLGCLTGTLGLTGSVLGWVAVHRKHHMSSDLEKDPHSPHRQAWWKVQFLSMYYRPQLRLVKDLIKEPFIVFCHRQYLTIQLVYVIFLMSVFGPFALIYAYLVPAAMLWHGGSCINTLGHLFGYRSFPTKDKSVNNPILGVLMWGEGWHNNHHAKPRRKKFGLRFWELDISYLIIRCVEKSS